MFIRTKKWKKLTSIQIVENTRILKQTKQRVLKYIGARENSDALWIKDLMKAAEYIKYELETQVQTWLIPFEEAEIELLEEMKEEHQELKVSKEELWKVKVNIFDLEEEQRVIKWINDVYGEMYKQMWFESIFWKKQKTQNYAQVLFEITMARIASPKSKRWTVEMLDRDYGIKIKLDDVYNMMWDLDDEKIQEIQDTTFYYTKTILNEKINVLFMDGTTLYFESQKEDWFREKWYSKDGKFSETQVALTLLVTESWLPIWYKLYHGSHYEWNSLKDTIEEVEKKYEINKVILVADSWFLNSENTTYLNTKGNKYILWARIKNLPNKLKEEILDKTGYTISKQDENGNMLEWYKEAEYQWRRLIVHYNKERAKKDAHEREKNIEKLKLKEWKDVQELISHFGYKKFLKQVWEATVEVDKEKVSKAALWDWLHGVLTNDWDMSCNEIGKYYKWLWQVEESFRINKHDLLIRPIFHWTQEKIKAHIAIAFMAFSLVRHLEYRLELQWYNYSPEVVRRELLRVQGSVIVDKTDRKERYFLPSQISDIWKIIYKCIGKKWNRNVQKVI